MRLKNYKKDLESCGLTTDQASALEVKDFDFRFVDALEKDKCLEIRGFIERHEWLGKMPVRPTHRFIATYNGILAGVVVMAGSVNFFVSGVFNV